MKTRPMDRKLQRRIETETTVNAASWCELMMRATGIVITHNTWITVSTKGHLSIMTSRRYRGTCVVCPSTSLSIQDLHRHRTVSLQCESKKSPVRFLADRTNGRAYATVLRPSSVVVVVCDVMYCG